MPPVGRGGKNKQVIKVIWYKAASPSNTVQSYSMAGANVPYWYYSKTGCDGMGMCW